MTRFAALLILSVSVVSVGCSNSPSPDPASSAGVAGSSATVKATATDDETAAENSEVAGSETTSPQTSDSAPSRTQSVELEIKSFDELKAFIASHKGRIVVVDYWSTSCEPCVTEFPHLVALSRKYPTEQVVCISASLEYDGLPNTPVEAARQTALEFLKEQKSLLHNVILSDDSLTVLDNKLEVPAIPVVEVYGADGALNRRFEDSPETPFSYESSINPLVEQLVSERFPQPAS